jgi:hypothetical protein
MSSKSTAGGGQDEFELIEQEREFGFWFGVGCPLPPFVCITGIVGRGWKTADYLARARGDSRRPDLTAEREGPWTVN